MRAAPPRVSVIIPTRNRWALLRRTLETVCAQQGVRFEVIVVDDASDQVGCAELPLDDPRFRLLRHASVHGVAHARNTGIEAAAGEWLAFLDDDDLWAPEKLSRQLTAAVAAEATCVCCGAARFESGATAVEVFRPPDARRLARELLHRNVIPAGSSNMLVLAEAVRAAGGFDEQLAQVADWDLWIRLVHEGRPATVPDCLVGYRIHGGNMAVHHNRPIFAELDRLAEKHRELAARYGVAPDRVRSTRWAAGSLSRAGRRLAAARVYLRGAVHYRDAGSALRAVAALFGDALKQRAGRLVGRSGAERGRGDVPRAGECSWLEGLLRAEVEGATER